MNKTQETVVVYLSPEQAELFVQFQKRFAFMQLMESLKVFEVRNGNVTVNFDGIGGISSVEINQVFRTPKLDKQNADTIIKK